jgi:hypothetical protein
MTLDLETPANAHMYLWKKVHGFINPINQDIAITFTNYITFLSYR